MSFIGKTIGKVVGGITGANEQAKAAQNAANTQSQFAQQGIDQQNQQFQALQKLLEPFVNAGTSALGAQQNLIGLNGADQQQQAINAIQNSPAFTSAQKTGNDAILANAAATGGIRGGNTQAALAQFSPQLLSQLIQQQYSNLGGLTSLGQNAAAGQGNAGLATGGNIAQLLQQQGAAQAGGQLAQGNTVSQSFGNLLKIAPSILGAFGGSPSGVSAPGGYTNFNVSPGIAPVNNALLQDFKF